MRTRAWAFLCLGAASGVAGLWKLWRSAEGEGAAGLFLMFVSLVLLGRAASGPGASPPRQPEPDDFVSDAEEWRKAFRPLVEWKTYRNLVVSVGIAVFVGWFLEWRALWDTIRRYFPWLAGVLPPGKEMGGVAVLAVSGVWLLALVRTVAMLLTRDSTPR